ncbi:MAG: photosynthetic complex assembly protein PuhC [Pseudomonadota bacterium]
MANNNDPFISKNALKMVGAWVGLSVIVVVVAVLMDDRKPLPAVPDDPRQVALITFDDTADGGMVIASDNAETVLPPDAHGFIRGVLRALARQRDINGIGPEHAFVLAEDTKGRFAIADPMTGTRIDLLAFGRDNTVAFAALLPTLAMHKAGE